MRRRLVFVVGLAVSWFLAAGVRLYHVQVVRHEHYRDRAVKQQNRVVTLTPPRGTIYDRRGRELAVSVEVSSVAADPTLVDDPAATAEALAGVLRLDADRLAADLGSDRSFVWIRRKVDPPLAEAVTELDLDGVFLVPENKRYYPLKTLAAQLLGYVGTDNKGLAGLEYVLDRVVASEPGKRIVVRDARFGTVLYPHFEVSAARPGLNVYLTIDAAIQHIVETELERAVASSNAARGMVVVMDPDSGAVLAMASHPTFDPNRFGAYPEDSWRNLPVMSAYEPGSTFKMITLAAALEGGALDELDVFDCGRGGIRFGKTLIKDHKSFAELTVRDIIAKSSNVGAIKIGQAAGRRRFYDTIKAFGFGSLTDIDLPSENPGILRPIDRWSELSPAYQAFGQGISVTAIQLTNAFAAIANGGRLLRPYVVGRVGRPGQPGYQEKSRHVVRLPISPSSVRQIREILETVVAEGGTAPAAALEHFPVAGKTGTAQKAVRGGGYSANRHVASFVGFAPSRDPAVVVTVILDEPRPKYHGGEVAAPVFRAIAEKTLLYLGVRPTRERPEPWPREAVRDPVDLLAEIGGAPRTEAPPAQAPPPPPGTLPDFAGLTARQAVTRSSRLGLRLELDGHGAVFRQSPSPGTPLETSGRRVKLWLARKGGA